MPNAQDRQKYYEAHKKNYPFEVIIEADRKSPDPRTVDRLRYGHFVRIPFPERNHTMWLFTTQHQAVMFQNDYHGRMG